LKSPAWPAIFEPEIDQQRIDMTQAASIAEEQQLIAEDFELFDDWRERIEYVLDLGRLLERLPEADYADSNKVRGCQSQVWMVAQVDPERGRMQIRADSDAFIVKGLISLLLRLYSNRRPEEILENPPRVFEEIGLGAHLSPTRANGLHAMIKRIRQLAAGYVHGAPVAAVS
jgi:cysteine desulfuration protein SufE